LSVQKAAQYLARKKALAVANEYPNDIVLGSDTTVVLENAIFGKPKTPEHAAEMLRQLSGKTHTVITGVALAQGERVSSFQTETAVTFYPLTEEQIQAYLATGEPMDKAGSYGIQGYGALLVQNINGDFYSVMGLPVAETARELQRFCKGCKIVQTDCTLNSETIFTQRFHR
jgi:septum formation protein